MEEVWLELEEEELGEELGLADGLTLGLTDGLAEGLGLGETLGEGAALAVLLEGAALLPQAQRDRVSKHAVKRESKRFMKTGSFQR